MTHPTHSTLIVSAIRDVTPERLQKAVLGLCDGSLTVTLTRQADNELRGLVRNGDGKEYGVTLTEDCTFCSCPDALWRGTSPCKHAVALALHVLRTPPQEKPQEKPASTPAPSHFIHIHHDTKAEPTPAPQRVIHLVLNDHPLCGAQHPRHFWKWPHWPNTEWKETCTDCTAIRKHPVWAAAA
jgi:SWIM zinc finger